jgi:predicted DsbA family dithiol-disulfide isomerase
MNDTEHSPQIPEDASQVDEAEQAELTRHGITRVPTAVYILGDYRYTKLADAVAQAKRSA